jgi:hypothetical protein
MASKRNDFGGFMIKKEYEKILTSLPKRVVPIDVSVMIFGIIHVYQMEDRVTSIFGDVLERMLQSGLITVDEEGHVSTVGFPHSKDQLH